MQPSLKVVFYKYPVCFILILSETIMILSGCTRKPNKKIFFDSFNTFDKKKWTYNENSFPDCGSTMTKENIMTNQSLLTITVNKSDTSVNGRKYKGGEIGSIEFMSYGTFTVRMKNNIAAGTVSSFFLMNKWKEIEWKHKEIDIEFLGKDPTKVQFSVHRLEEGQTDYIRHIKVYDLGFDSSEDFNEYGIRWTKDSICWLVNGIVAHTETRHVPDTLMQIRLNHWIANENAPWTTEWLGNIDSASLPSKVLYDWVQYESIE